MPLSMYSASVPALTRFLNGLSGLLNKAQAYATERKIEEPVLTGARLFPDMLPLTKQVQIACDVSKGCAGRLAGVELPAFEDTETTFAELQARISKTLDFISSISAEQINGTEDKTITLKLGPNEVSFSGADYLLGFVLPNVYFHISTAYGILRHNGVAIGKLDYLGQAK